MGGPPAPVVGHWFHCHDQQVITFLTFQFPFQSQHKGYRCITCQINSWCTCLILICIFECIHVLRTNHQYIFLLISFLILEGWSFLMEDCASVFPFCPPGFVVYDKQVLARLVPDKTTITTANKSSTRLCDQSLLVVRHISYWSLWCGLVI